MSLTDVELSVVEALAGCGCCHCGTPLLRGQGGTINNVAWVRTDRNPVGFEVYCLTCIKLLVNGELNVTPPKNKRPIM